MLDKPYRLPSPSLTWVWAAGCCGAGASQKGTCSEVHTPSLWVRDQNGVGGRVCGDLHFCRLYLEAAFLPLENSGPLWLQLWPNSHFLPKTLFSDVNSLKKNKQCYLFIFREEGREGEREEEKHPLVAYCTHPNCDQPTTQAHALTGNRTSELLLCRRRLNQLSHAGQGYSFLWNERGKKWPCRQVVPSAFCLLRKRGSVVW